MAKLSSVFGVSANSASPSYVDRGHYDGAFKDALATDKHVAVHGGSKQGKSWLRSRALPSEKSILIQCTPDATAQSLISDALGKVGTRVEDSRVVTNTAGTTFNSTGRTTVPVGPVTGEQSQGFTAALGRETEVTSHPVGQTEHDLHWAVARLKESKRTLVLEDFHYLREAVQKEMSFLIKAMGEYGLFVVVVGVWPEDHRLSYFNGDLDGRVVDLQLMWNDDDLREVLRRGSKSLRVELGPEIVSEMVEQSYGGVGLLQRLAEAYCRAEGVANTTFFLKRPRQLENQDLWEGALRSVASEMQGRYQTFADNFVRGMRRLSHGLEVYKYLLQAVTEASDADLLAGLDSADLHHRITQLPGGDGIRPGDLTQALDRIDRLQVKIEIKPLVLTYRPSDRRLFVADRSFYFYRRHGAPSWPWATGELELTNDLAAAQPLDLEP